MLKGHGDFVSCVNNDYNTKVRPGIDIHNIIKLVGTYMVVHLTYIDHVHSIAVFIRLH